MKCIKSSQNIIQIKKKLGLFSVRIDKLGNLKNGKPCEHCIYIIRKNINIKYIYYTDNNGILIKEKIEDFNSNHICLKNKHNRTKLSES